jgi:uncharacterized membrane protein
MAKLKPYAIAAGLRSLTPPALLSFVGARGRGKLGRSGFAFLKSQGAPYAFGALAAAELVADKFPGIPARIKPGPLTARVASGALCGAAVFAAEHERVAVGALVGGGAAAASSFAAYHLRKNAVEHEKTTAFWAALAEDALTLAGGAGVVRALARR